MSNIIRASIKEDRKYWTIDTSGIYLNAIKQYLLDDNIPKEGVNSIVANSSKTLGFCPNPNSDTTQRVTGIMIGKVQSGKTSSFIALTAAAFDNGYDVIIILGGTKNELLKQNKERVQEYFAKTNVVVLSVVEDYGEINEESIKHFIVLGKKVIIMALKHQDRIDKLSDVIRSSYYLKEKPVLIIDDEGDEHTPNNMVKKNKESTKYKSIKRLRDSFDKCAFISVTATPQANLIMPIIDVLSPDFAVLVKPGKGYCGLDVFHCAESKHCVIIPDEEKTILDNDGIPSSFYDALMSYYVASAEYHLRTDSSKKFSMLIHPSGRVSDISSVREKTRLLIIDWIKKLQNPNDIECDTLKERFKKVYQKYVDDGSEMHDFDVIYKMIYEKEILDSAVHLITGKHHLDDKDKNYTNNIYVGGEMVGRGLTFKGLAITYIIRTSKGKSNVDTVQQRARWFGYKSSYIDLCKVYAIRKIIDEFEKIKVHEEDMWDTIVSFNLTGRNFKNMRRLFVLNDSLRPTRTSVGTTHSHHFSLWTCENKFIENQDYQKFNMELIGGMMDEFEFKSSIDKHGNKTIRDVSFEYIVDKYLNRFITPIGAKLDNEFIKKIAKYLKNNDINAVCDLVWPRYKNGYQKISVDTDGTIHNYMVGQRPENVSLEEAVYKGDRYIMRGDVIEIQFHNIIKPNGETSLCMALYIPPKYHNIDLIEGD